MAKPPSGGGRIVGEPSRTPTSSTHPSTQRTRTMIRYIALCGAPKAGKTEIARILERDWKVEQVDDKGPLRDAVRTLYGLTDWHVDTQEGKAALVDVGGKQVDVRTLLGELGLYMEKDDPHHFARLALREVQASGRKGPFCFPSVRHDQAKVFKATGEALVIEVVRPGCAVVNGFDWYDPSLADVQLHNTWKGRGSITKLEDAIAAIVEPYLGKIEA